MIIRPKSPISREGRLTHIVQEAFGKKRLVPPVVKGMILEHDRLRLTPTSLHTALQRGVRQADGYSVVREDGLEAWMVAYLQSRAPKLSDAAGVFRELHHKYVGRSACPIILFDTARSIEEQLPPEHLKFLKLYDDIDGIGDPKEFFEHYVSDMSVPSQKRMADYNLADWVQTMIAIGMQWVQRKTQETEQPSTAFIHNLLSIHVLVEYFIEIMIANAKFVESEEFTGCIRAVDRYPTFESFTAITSCGLPAYNNFHNLFQNETGNSIYVLTRLYMMRFMQDRPDLYDRLARAKYSYVQDSGRMPLETEHLLYLAYMYIAKNYAGLYNLQDEDVLVR